MAYTLAQIAHIETDFSEKFGIPRQSGLVEELRARIVFEPEFRSPDAVRGLDGYDYIWLVWQFSTVVQAGQDGTNWRPTVRPPRLGGNTRMGVFATRSPFRPNALGLSSVKLLKVEPNTPQGPVLTVGGSLINSCALPSHTSVMSFETVVTVLVGIGVYAEPAGAIKVLGIVLVLASILIMNTDFSKLRNSVFVGHVIESMTFKPNAWWTEKSQDMDLFKERTGIALEPTVQESPWYFVR